MLMESEKRTRQTSVDAYNSLIRNDKIRRIHKIIYDLLYKFGPLTAAEVWFKARTGSRIDSFRPRMAELERMRMIEPVGMRKCYVTTHNCMIWDVTENLFIPAPRPPTESEHGKVKVLRRNLNRALSEIERLHGIIEELRRERMQDQGPGSSASDSEVHETALLPQP